MITIKNIEGFTDAYPDQVKGTNEWYYCKQYRGSARDLCQVIGIIEEDGRYPGSTCKLIHYPDGKVYQPFEMKADRYIEEPVYDNGKIAFLVVDFGKRRIEVYHFLPKEEELVLLAEVPLERNEDCDQLNIKTAPLMLCRDNFYKSKFEIIWPEKKEISVGAKERIMFGDGDTLFMKEWELLPETGYHEYVVVRDRNTGEVRERFSGSMSHMPDGSYWKIKTVDKGFE
ncbi:MAG: hypothetical protein Q4G58_11340 [bacterium]|nr:hypothetical protein [bacterium]